jgi:ubiquinone/menaquinone biosynthesis C-methylase UbiE
MDDRLRRYAASRATERGAASYETKYDRQLHKRISNRVERAVIAKAFAVAPGPYGLALDLPCGAGRLTPEIARHVSGAIVEADYSPTMLERARTTARSRGDVGARRYTRLDALTLPFRDAAFDLVFSARLSHHIAHEPDRERWLLELCRVSRRTVIATVFDHHSLKNVWRLARSAFSHKRPKNTLRLARVHELAERAGFEVRAAIPISRLFSGHRYLVLARRGS